jgi:hypothetical protein
LIGQEEFWREMTAGGADRFTTIAKFFTKEGVVK